MATNVIAFTASERPIVQPNAVAKSPIRTVRTPMKRIEAKKQPQPSQYAGVNENMACIVNNMNILSIALCIQFIMSLKCTNGARDRTDGDSVWKEESKPV